MMSTLSGYHRWHCPVPALLPTTSLVAIKRPQGPVFSNIGSLVGLLFSSNRTLASCATEIHLRGVALAWKVAPHSMQKCSGSPDPPFIRWWKQLPFITYTSSFHQRLNACLWHESHLHAVFSGKMGILLGKRCRVRRPVWGRQSLVSWATLSYETWLKKPVTYTLVSEAGLYFSLAFFLLRLLSRSFTSVP